MAPCRGCGATSEYLIYERATNTRLTFGRSLHLPPLGLYPSTGVDQAIFGTKFRAQKHKRGTFIQTSSMIFVEHKMRSNNDVHAVLARVNTRGIQMKFSNLRLDFRALLATHLRMIHELAEVNQHY